MKTITIKIVKKSVMGVVEGLSATIAQHNPEVDFQTVWASDAEEAKLDIYYREAITDLENFLARFSSSTTQQFDLQALADDFSITIKTLAYWPARLSGVLTNQIQNYLVHAIMAGWLSDFPEMNHTDYASMGASDLDSIKEVLLKKDFSFAETRRSEDDTKKELSSATDTYTRVMDGEKENISVLDGEARSQDGEAKHAADTSSYERGVEDSEKHEGSSKVSERAEDSSDKQQNGFDAGKRAEDSLGKGSSTIDTEERQTDTTNKATTTLSSSDRAKDGTQKSNNGVSVSKRTDDGTGRADSLAETEARNEDNACQCFFHEHVDWSGGLPPYELR